MVRDFAEQNPQRGVATNRHVASAPPLPLERKPNPRLEGDQLDPKSLGTA